MSQKIKWGLLAAGAIAKAFTDGIEHSETGELLAVGSRSQEKADDFARAHAIPRAYGSYESLLADADVDAVYISTPHPMHAEWAIKAAEAGKHLLVEKPLGLNQYEVQAMIDAAVRHNVFLMEAFMYRCHPQTAKLLELLQTGAVGTVHLIKATFSFQAGFNRASRIWNNALGGGGILDVGGYTTSMARLAAGAAMGQAVAEPISVSGAGVLHPETGVDAYAIASLAFENGIIAAVATGVGVQQDNEVRIYGSEGSILLPNPWVAARQGEADGHIVLQKKGAEEDILLHSAVTSFAYEADVAGRAILQGRQQAEAPAMTWADSLGNARTLDAWRDAIGLVYEAEKPKRVETVHRRPLQVRDDSKMSYGEIEHCAKPVSRLIMGIDNQDTMPHLAAICDDYFERGGNTFDTAHVYGRKRSQLLGQWIRQRNIREQVLVIAKGAHTPLCFPENLSSQLFEQLEWYGSDYADIYLLHRDNPEVPVGEFVEVLNEHVRAGRIRAFGGSNWSLERVAAANQYADEHNLQGFSVISNNLSLAEMVNPVWDGCIHVHDAASREWLRNKQITLLPWSSQARGFFVPERAHPEKKNDAQLLRCWYSAANFKRQARAVELAQKYAVEPINIALAWVLCQPFPTYPLIGPRTIAETRSSFRALDVQLAKDEMEYLNLGD